MKAVIIEKPDVVKIAEIDIPDPGPGEVLLRSKAGGICGTDIHIMEGNFLGSYPVIPCHEVAAEVVKVGNEAEKLAIGDAVAVDPNIRCGQCPMCLNGKVNLCENYDAIGVTRPGGFAEFFTVPVTNVHKFEGCNFSSAAFAEPLACVLYGLSKLTISPGDHVIIWGSGAIGLLHLQVCTRLRGARVTMVDIDPARIEKAKNLGAQYGFSADDTLEEKLKDINSTGWDIAIDATGNVKAVSQMFSHLKRGGEALIFGVYPKEQQLSISPFDIFLNDWKIYGSFTYRHEFSAAVNILSSKMINVESLIDHRINPDLLPETLTRLSRGERMGKLQVEM